MAFDLDSLSYEQRQAALLRVLAVLSEAKPGFDFREGTVLGQLVADPVSLIQALADQDLERLRQSWSLQYISKAPEQFTDADVDAVLANYNITRRPGSRATGTARIVLLAPVSTVIPETMLFTHDGLSFRPTANFVGLPNAIGITTESDRLIVAAADGTFSFTVSLEAVEAGSAYRIRRGSLMDVSPSIPALVSVTADADFQGGEDTETNSELIARLAGGRAARSVADRVSIVSLCRDAVPGLAGISCIGAGDIEQVRGRDNLFAVSSPGFVDVYARTALLPDTVTATVSGERISGNLFRVHVPRELAAGMYTVDAVVLRGSGSIGSLPVSDLLRLVSYEDFSGVAPAMAAYSVNYSAFQAFWFTVEAASASGATAEFEVTMTGYAGVRTLQESIFSNRDVTDPAGDYLVKAPNPCFVGVNLRVLSSDPSEVDTSAVSAAVAKAVNGTGFAGALEVSALIDAAYGALGGSAMVQLPVDVRGTLRLPNGQLRYAASSTRLLIDDIPEQGVSRRTSVFICTPDQVDVEVVNA